MRLVSLGAHLEDYGDAGVNHCFLVAIYNIYSLRNVYRFTQCNIPIFLFLFLIK